MLQNYSFGFYVQNVIQNIILLSFLLCMNLSQGLPYEEHKNLFFTLQVLMSYSGEGFEGPRGVTCLW